MTLQNSLTRHSPENKKRYYLLDSVRGICVLGMIVYHTLFDIVEVFEIPVTAEVLLWVNLVRDLGAALFILMSGFCFSLGRHHLRHILVLSGLGLGITLVTMLVMPEMTVYFGILSFLGAACLIMCGLEKLFLRLPPVQSAGLCFLLFFTFISVNYGYIGYGNVIVTYLPEALYRNFFTAFLGFPFSGFTSGDYFGVFPWIFAYFFGFFLYHALKGNEKAERLLCTKVPFLWKAGKPSLYIYVIHQPVVFGLAVLLKILIG